MDGSSRGWRELARVCRIAKDNLRDDMSREELEQAVIIGLCRLEDAHNTVAGLLERLESAQKGTRLLCEMARDGHMDEVRELLVERLAPIVGVE